MLTHVAVLAYHSSPLTEPGAGDAGGMTVYVRELAEALAQRGVATDIFTRATSSSRPVTTLRSGVRVVAVEAGPPVALSKDELSRHVDDFAMGVRAFATAQRVRYDVVHSHYWQSGLAGRALSRAWGTPFVHSQHTLARVKNRYLAPGDTPEPQTRIDGEDAVTSAADVMIASTDDEWQQLACLYDVAHDRLKTIHPGVDHCVFRPGDRAADRAGLGLSDEAMMLYVGRIQPLKGLELAIRAAGQLVPRLDRPLLFHVVGGESGAAGANELARLRTLAASLDVGSNIRFVGATSHDEVPRFYRAADAVVVCSYSESFGLAALEAHACGTPVVGTSVGGLSHIVQDGSSGFLVGSRDPEVFAARLETILSSEAVRLAFADNALRSASSFSWQATADSLLELYECLLREGWPQLCTC
ncbi:MAG: glycosyltransferase [Actinomycetota bacterium]